MLLQLFWTFMKVGFLGFGGDYTLLALMQGEVTAHGWMDAGQFADIAAISQATPGPVALNAACHIGYTSMLHAGYGPLWAVLGSFLSACAVVLPSFVLMLLLCRFLLRYRNHRFVDYAFSGLRPALVGILLALPLMLLTHENFSSLGECPWRFCISILIFLFALIANRLYRLKPLFVLLACGCAGMLLF